MRGEKAVALSIVAEGPEDPSRFAGLQRRIGGLEVIPVPDGATRQAAVLNPLIDEAGAHWILLVRSDERISDELAAEIARSTTSDPRAWGCRISVRSIYCGRPLGLGRRDPGEVRLFHRRRARLQPDGRMKVQGTVVRLRTAIDRVLYESEDAHREALRASGRREAGFVRHVLEWMSELLRNLPGSLAKPARRYLWIEAGWRKARNDQP